MGKTFLLTCRLICIALFFSNCAGFDDWAGLDVFDEKMVASETTDYFSGKRYVLPGLSSSPVVEFIVDSKNKVNVEYAQQIRKACDYSKLPYNEIDLSNWNRGAEIKPTTRVICIYNSQTLSTSTLSKLLEFVSRGGSLFIPFITQDKRFGYFFGLKPNAEYSIDSSSKGIFASTPILPGLKDKVILKNEILYGFAESNFNSTIEFLATAANNSKYPCIYKNKIGLGNVIVFNTANTLSKIDRGLLFSGMLQGLEGVPYPIANASTVFLDDFPSPQYDAKVQPIADELNLTMFDFVKKVWWPDMKKISKTYGIPYTAMTTFDYRNKIVPPFTFDQWNEQKMLVNKTQMQFCDWLVADVARNRYEVAFHGYNQ